MRREEMFMDILGGLDEKYVSMAMPRSCGHSTVGDTGNVIEIKPVEVSPEVSKKDMRIYWITRALGMAAALALVVGGGVWLWQNWDKIAVKEPDRPGVVTAVSESITTTIAKPDITSETTNDVTVSDNTITSDIESDTIIDENPENTIERPLQWANPASGMGTDWDTEPTDSRFYLIPLELMVKVEGVVSYVEDCEGYLTDSRYKEYTSSVYVEPEDRTGVDTGINIYTFIKFFDISDNDVREALADKHTLAGDYTSEEVEILLSGDKSAIGRTFSSKWAIVKGEKIYSPYWLQNNSYDKWEAAGITADDISSHFDELTDVPVYLVEEDFIPKYKAIMNNYIVYCERRTADENIGLNDVQTVQPTFEASLNLLREHTINVEHYPNETSTVYGKCTADGSGYDWLSYGIKLDGFITNLSAANKQIKSEFDMDALVEAVSPYCDEQGNLLHDLLKMLPDVQMYFILSGKKMNSAENGYSHYLVGNDFLLEYYNYNNTVEIYRRSEHKTVFRHILELLWKKYNDTSGITAIATDDYRSGSHDSYMMIIGERDTLNSVKKYLEDSGVDLSICRFSTPEEMRNSWLTVTRLEYDENEIYARYPILTNGSLQVKMVTDMIITGFTQTV